jgi:hypothetical protein
MWFLALLRSLAASTLLEVRQVALRMLGYYGDRDDAVAEAAALAARQPGEQNDALGALGTVGTNAAFSVLLPYAEAGNVLGLAAALKQARTESARMRILELAQRFILGEDFHLRMISLRCLQQLSRPEREEDLLVEAVRRHPDELVIAVLKHATPRVLPALREIYTSFPPESAEAGDLAETLQELEMHTQTQQ